MALVPMDFSGEIKPLTPGVYSMRIVGAEVKYSKEKNQPYVNWNLEAFGSPDVNGQRVFYTTPLQGGWVTKLADLHRAATGEEIDKTAKQYDPEMLVGREVTATLVTRNYTTNTGEQRSGVEIKAVARKQ